MENKIFVMKSSINIKNILFSAILAAVVFTSCDKDDPPVDVPKNVVQVAQSDTSFSILVAAVVKTGLVDALSNTQNLTVFAPVNSAFRALGYTEASINALTDATAIAGLKTVLQYHVLAERIPSSAITTANIEKTALAGGKVYATKTAAGVFINGVKVAIADVSASNGVIHAVSKVLLPAAGNLKAVAAATPAFSYLVAAVLRADSTTNDISNALTSAGPLTVMAPTNDAFIAAGFPTVASINAAPPFVLRRILLYHVIPARVFSCDLTDNANVPTALGGSQTLKINLPPARVTGLGNGGTASNITGTDVMATNGVIHVIDRVLLPQ
jgi:uncharacterized surface protein with fasciclin (FAS1) repeats